MKKLFIILGTVLFLLLAYILIEQYRQYNVGKTNLKIMLANDSYTKDSVTFKVYLNDSLIITCQRNHHLMLLPYSDIFGIKTSWGKHKITVIIDDGFMTKDFYVRVGLVRYCMIYFAGELNFENSRLNHETLEYEGAVFEEFVLGVNVYSMIFRFLHLVG